MLAVIWWMYDGYAWLTNAIATDLLRFRLLLLGGMGGVPRHRARDPERVRLDRPRVRPRLRSRRRPPRGDVREGHVGLRGRGDPPDRPVQPARRPALVLVGGAVGGRPQDVLWAGAAILVWFTPWLASTEGFVIAAEHFCERHGLVIIVALGESIVVIGAARSGVPLDLRLALVALLALALSAALWWLYFRDEDAVEHAMTAASDARRAAARADRLRLLALRAAPRGRRGRRGSEEGDRRSVRPARRVDRRRARRRRRAVHRLDGRFQTTLGHRRQPLATRRGGGSRSRRSRSGRNGRRPVSSRCSQRSSSARSSSRHDGTCG